MIERKEDQVYKPRHPFYSPETLRTRLEASPESVIAEVNAGAVPVGLRFVEQGLPQGMLMVSEDIEPPSKNQIKSRIAHIKAKLGPVVPFAYLVGDLLDALPETQEVQALFSFYPYPFAETLRWLPEVIADLTERNQRMYTAVVTEIPEGKPYAEISRFAFLDLFPMALERHGLVPHITHLHHTASEFVYGQTKYSRILSHSCPRVAIIEINSEQRDVFTPQLSSVINDIRR